MNTFSKPKEKPWRMCEQQLALKAKTKPKPTDPKRQNQNFKKNIINLKHNEGKMI